MQDLEDEKKCCEMLTSGHDYISYTNELIVFVDNHARLVQEWALQNSIMNSGEAHLAPPFSEELLGVNGYWRRGTHFVQW